MASQADVWYNIEQKYVALAVLETPKSVTNERLGFTRMDSIPQKCCSKCGIMKPLNAFHKKSGRVNQYQSYCKPCCTIYLREQRKSLATRHITPSSITCLKCQETKEITDFYRDSSNISGYMSVCKSCHSKQMYIKYREKHGEVRGTTFNDGTARRCTRCKEIKPFEEFVKRGPKRGGYGTECKACKRVRSSEEYHASPIEQARIRGKNLKKNFGITLEEYNAMLTLQNGLCAVCRKEETRIDPRRRIVSSLAVDHDHTTGAIRGLLCYTCNMALGFLQEDPDRIQSLLAYLLKYKGG